MTKDKIREQKRLEQQGFWNDKLHWQMYIFDTIIPTKAIKNPEHLIKIDVHKQAMKTKFR